MLREKTDNIHILTEREKRLMSVLFYEGATKADIKLFTKDLDVDTASSDYMLMLSYLGIATNWEWYPKEIVPRLKGLHRYYQVRNALGIKELLRQIDILAEAGISVMFIKGMAIRHYYAPGVPRIMSDMDLLVKPEQFERAIELLHAAGGSVSSTKTLWSVHVINGMMGIDLHRWFFKHHGEKKEEVWERAIPIDFYGRTVYVPNPEDMFVHQLDTRARAIFCNEAESRRMRWLYDCGKICGRDGFCWQDAMQRIKAFHVENTAWFMLKAFTDCFPDILPDSLIKENLVQPDGYKKWIRFQLKYREFKKGYLELVKKQVFWRYVLIWPKLRYYDYCQNRLDVKIVDDIDLTVVQYLKNSFQEKTLRGCFKKLIQKIHARVEFCKKGDSCG